MPSGLKEKTTDNLSKLLGFTCFFGEKMTIVNA